jgi:hypothetical protein
MQPSPTLPSNPDSADPPGSSETQVLERLAPAVTWWPRWFRKHLTPQMVIAAVVMIFSAGTFWANFRTSRDVKDAQRDVRDLKTEVNRKLDEIGGRSSKVDVIEKGQQDLERRMNDLEEDFKWAKREAGTPPYSRKGPPARRPK